MQYSMKAIENSCTEDNSIKKMITTGPKTFLNYDKVSKIFELKDEIDYFIVENNRVRCVKNL